MRFRSLSGPPLGILCARVLVLLVVASFASTSARAAEPIKESLWAMLEEIYYRYNRYSFASVVRLGSRGDMRRALDGQLRVEFDPSMRPAGKYYPGSDLLVVKSFALDNEGDLVTVYHEFFHHLLDINGSPGCMEDEAYTAILEDRLDWLNRLARFEDRYRAATSLTEQTCRVLVDQWQRVESGWRNGGTGAVRSVLSGPYTFFDSSGTCGSVEARYYLTAERIRYWDNALKFRVRIEDVSPLYRPKLQQCQSLLTNTQTSGSCQDLCHKCELERREKGRPGFWCALCQMCR